MNKRNKIIYWIATIWLCLGLSSAGIVQLIPIEDEVTMFTHLGYPLYLLPLLGVLKLLAVVALLVPRFPLVKEWAYAGAVFNMIGALYSHIAMGDAFADTAPMILFFVLIAASWYFRPADRKIVVAS